MPTLTRAALNPSCERPTIVTPRSCWEGEMEDYELQEVEFWRKLEEESMSRNAMLRRSAAAAFGLTILSSPVAAWAARSGEAEAMTAAGISLKELIKRAKKEGQLNVIALPHDWANYGEIISTFKKKYGLKMDEANPNGSSAQEDQGGPPHQGGVPAGRPSPLLRAA